MSDEETKVAVVKKVNEYGVSFGEKDANDKWVYYNWTKPEWRGAWVDPVEENVAYQFEIANGKFIKSIRRLAEEGTPPEIKEEVKQAVKAASGRDRSIELQVCLKAAVEFDSHLVHNPDYPAAQRAQDIVQWASIFSTLFTEEA